jgi:hypothetical protein
VSKACAWVGVLLFVMIFQISQKAAIAALSHFVSLKTQWADSCAQSETTVDGSSLFRWIPPHGLVDGRKSLFCNPHGRYSDHPADNVHFIGISKGSRLLT